MLGLKLIDVSTRGHCWAISHYLNISTDFRIGSRQLPFQSCAPILNEICDNVNGKHTECCRQCHEILTRNSLKQWCHKERGPKHVIKNLSILNHHASQQLTLKSSSTASLRFSCVGKHMGSCRQRRFNSRCERELTDAGFPWREHAIVLHPEHPLVLAVLAVRAGTSVGSYTGPTVWSPTYAH